MKKNFQTNNNEIDLIELMQIIWKGKWKIAVAVVVSCIATIMYQSTLNNNFTAITEVKPISYLEMNKYLAFNNFITNTKNTTKNTTKNNTNTNTNTNTNMNTVTNINVAAISKITRSELLDLYINILNNKSVFVNAIRKFNLLEASQYNNDQEYSEAIIRLASSIKILSPLVRNETNLEIFYHTIHFNYHDVKKWKSVLIYVDELANELAKKNLLEQYNNTLILLQQERKFELEDILVKKNNYLIDYEREASDRIAYLKEQSAIAKELGIAKNTIEVLTSGNLNALLSNVQTASPFYLRGYEAIDKEIELIEFRKNKEAFIKGLYQLEKEKRAIEQNQTIERIKLALQSNLIEHNQEFSAASIKTITTEFKYNNNNRKMLVIAIVIGLMAGIFYVIISNAFLSQRISRKKTN